MSTVYITRDIERALGKTPSSDYFIVTNDNPYARTIKKQFPDYVWCISAPELLDTYELLTHPEVTGMLETHRPAILVFKNTTLIETYCREHALTLLNPSATLSRTVEEKISQVTWLGELSSLLPPHLLTTLEEVEFADAPLVLQFNHAHTGEGTHIIFETKTLETLQEKFPKRPVRVSRFIDGPVFTLISCVTPTGIIPGSINYQITGLPPFTTNRFATIGNDYAFAQNYLSDRQKETIEAIAEKVGSRLARDGWKGLFGIDCIVDHTSGMVYLLEINCRQQAGTTFESQLHALRFPQEETLFSLHLNSLKNTSSAPDQHLSKLSTGSQIIFRNSSTPRSPESAPLAALARLGLTVIPYTNTTEHSELLRIQSFGASLIADHNSLSPLGLSIAHTLESL